MTLKNLQNMNKETYKRKYVYFTVGLELDFTKKGSTKVTAGQKLVIAKQMIDIIANAINQGDIVNEEGFGYFFRNACAKADTPKRLSPIFGKIIPSEAKRLPAPTDKKFKTTVGEPSEE